VVAFAVGADGRAGPAQRAPLPIRPGELAVRMVPLPGGGALLTDLERRHVVWLGEDATPLGSAAWPTEESDAVCLDGRPMRRVVPGPAPGQFVAVPDVAEGSCIVGDPVWGPDGRLRWLGATVIGLDSHAEVVSLALLPSSAPGAALASGPGAALASGPGAALAPGPGAALASGPGAALASGPGAALAPGAAPGSTPALVTSLAPVADPPRRCPADMVSIAGRYCVDRFEAALADARTGVLLSPDYPTTPGLLDFALGEWATARERTGTLHARAFPLPWLSPTRIGDKPEPVAVSRLGARPNGYVTGVVAEAACTAAGKRLCTLDEFVTACRGDGDTLFPYGDGVCNVFREEHPAAILHGNASVGHLDPRLDRVWSKGRPLLQRTGESPGCRSKWGDDAVYDLVGNLDEWVNEGGGAFAGGFYSRSTRSGCEAVVSVHPKSYLDYSTGVRCCQD
jgi:hypothetical protein